MAIRSTEYINRYRPKDFAKGRMGVPAASQGANVRSGANAASGASVRSATFAIGA